MFFVACGDSAVVFDFTEEPLDGIAEFVEAGAEGRFADPLRHEPDVGQDAAGFHFRAQGVRIISAVGKQDIAFAESVEHVGGTAPVGSLARCDLQQDRQAIGIDQRMDLGRQPAF